MQQYIEQCDNGWKLIVVMPETIMPDTYFYTAYEDCHRKGEQLKKAAE